MNTTPRETHTAIITQTGATGYLLASPPDGYLVTCPHGCNLGTTARQATREGAERRVELHQIATAGHYVNCYYHHGGNLPCPDQTDTGH